MSLEVYINNTKLDLFPDEKIEINDKIQDIKDISKLFYSLF